MEIELNPATPARRHIQRPYCPCGYVGRGSEHPSQPQHYKILYICGNYSRILSRLDRRFTSLEVRRAFTSFQLMTILEENHHSFMIIEHDPMLYEDAKQMVEYVGQALKQTSREATILLYAPALDQHLQTMTELADRVFCIYEGEKAPVKGRAKVPANQAPLEVYS